MVTSEDCRLSSVEQQLKESVFAVKDGRARTTRNNRMAEVLSGLSEGDRVVLHPSDRLKDGVAVAQRATR